MNKLNISFNLNLYLPQQVASAYNLFFSILFPFFCFYFFFLFPLHFIFFCLAKGFQRLLHDSYSCGEFKFNNFWQQFKINKQQQMKEQNQCHQNHLNSFRIKGKITKTRHFQVEHYLIGELIGKGGFASVHKAVEMHTRVQVAAKIIDVNGISERDLHHLRREILIHTQLNHPNIVRIYETVWTQSRVYIFMELVKGQELFNVLNKNGPLHQSAAAKVFGQIVDAVRYMHGLNIAHRDIKTENIIIDSDFNAKLIDFGLAKIYNSPTDDYLETFCGSPSYVAPELIQNKRYHGQRVDIWCLGVTLYTMIEACLPFDGCDTRMREANICYLNWHKPLYSSKQAIQIYKLIFKKENKRIQIDQLINTQFFSKYKLVEKMSDEKIDSSRDYLRASKNSEFQRIADKVSGLLNVGSDEVEIAMRNKVIGSIYCVFNLLWARRHILQHYQHPKKDSKSQNKTAKQSFNTLEPRSLKKSHLFEKERPKSRQDSSLIKILPVINDAHHPLISTPSKHQKQFDRSSKNAQIHQKYHLQVLNKEEIAKQAIKMKAQRFKNIFSKDIGIKEIKPRLREDSPDSPKRILDCVKVYN